MALWWAGRLAIRGVPGGLRSLLRARSCEVGTSPWKEVKRPSETSGLAARRLTLSQGGSGGDGRTETHREHGQCKGPEAGKSSVDSGSEAGHRDEG